MKVKIKDIEELGLTSGKSYTVTDQPNNEEVEIVDDDGRLRRLFNHQVSIVWNNMEV